MLSYEQCTAVDVPEQKFSVYGLIPLLDSIHGNLRQAVEFVQQEQWKAGCTTSEELRSFSTMTAAQIEHILLTAQPGANGNATCGALMFKRIGSAPQTPQQIAPAHAAEVALPMENEAEIPENEAALV